MKTEPLQGRVVKKNRVIELYVSLGPEKVIVPDLYGKTEGEARYLLEQAGLKPSYTREYNDEYGAGVVFRQTPAAGTNLSRDDEVHIFVSLGGKSFLIENLIGRSREYALEYLDEKGLVPRLRYEVSDEPAGTVVEQLPGPGSSVHAGQSVDLVISSGSGDG